MRRSRGTRRSWESGDRDSDALVPELRDFCRSKLPDFMVPSEFVLLEALPLTPNGKIDRKRLPAPEARRVSATAAPPATDLERKVVGVFEELVAGTVGVDENFFDAGVNSLLMVQASIRLRSLLRRPVPLVQMFQYPTARTLAAALGRSGSEGTGDNSPADTSRASRRRDAMERRRAIQARR